MTESKIEWTGETWNPVTGCVKIGRGCDNCYASMFAERFRGVDGHPYKMGFDITLRPKRLSVPSSRSTPTTYFVNSMSDLFLKQIPRDYLDTVFSEMEGTPRHTFQVLTKRSSLMRDYMNARYAGKKPPAHIWVGVSVEDRRALSRVAHLQKTAASVRFLSVEPLLEDLGQIDLESIHWVIIGGESGPKARRMMPEWARSVRKQCIRSNVPVFFKQWGQFSEAGKRARSSHANGRVLDGRIWSEMPVSSSLV